MVEVAFDRRAYDQKYVRESYEKKKQGLIEQLGGQCVHCGSQERLQFDHIDPTQKTLVITEFRSHPWNLVLEEIKKCQLLCKGCHLIKSRAEGSLARNNPIGQNAGSSKLTEQDVLEILRLSKLGVGPRKLATQFGVDRSCIGFIKAGKTWKHIPRD